jgi:HEAT repeat protein
MLATVAVLAGLAAGAPPGQAAARPEGDAVAVALRHVDEAERRQDAESLAMVSVALDVAGPAVVPALVERLRATTSTGRGALAAWALGRSAARGDLLPGTPAPDAVAALRAALASPSWDVRLAAASSLGALDATTASTDLSDLLLRRDRPEPAEGVLLLAIAGAGGPATSQLWAALERGPVGDAEVLPVLAAYVRRGATSWPELAWALREHPSRRVREAAAATLLVLAEPSSACEVGDALALERDPVLRRVILQVLAATAAPSARRLLEHAAEVEVDAALRDAADRLRASSGVAGARDGEPAFALRSVRELLVSVAAGSALPQDLDEIERRAEPSDLPVLGRALRRLPLRQDATWLQDHARLAQLRARLLAASTGP